MATTTLQAVYDQAQRLLEENETERAIGLIEHLLEHFPDNLEAHRLLGEASLIARQFEQAEAAFRRVLNADPENIPAHVGMGITFERQGKLDRAISEFEQALEIKPDMAELRTQLLRLYVDAWGNEHAQLRLSRPGLARLYAKGHMLPQAIQEFRSVVAEQPDRFDARVGLIESLWRQGQEEMLVEVCEEMLTERHDVLKANLLLGYVKLAAGDPDGEYYWKVAQQLDPYQYVALALFGDVPEDAPMPETSLPEWNELEWRLRQEQEKQVVTAPAAEVTREAPAAMPADGAPPTPVSDDDFLSQLLGLQGGVVSVSSEEPVTPFTFQERAGQDNGVEEARSRSAPDVREGGATAADEADEMEISKEVQPFDFSFDMDDRDNTADVGQPPPSATGQPAEEAAPQEPGERISDEPEGTSMSPFAFEDLDLSDETVAPPLLEKAEERPEGPPVSEPPQPLADFPFLEGEREEEERPEDLPGMEPFGWDMEDKDQGPTEPPSSVAPPSAPEAAHPTEPDQPLEPFDMGALDEDEFAGIEPFGASPSAPEAPEATEPKQPVSPTEPDQPLEPFDVGSLDEDEFAGIEPFGASPTDVTGGEPAETDDMPERDEKKPSDSFAGIDPFDWSTDAIDAMEGESWQGEGQSFDREGIGSSLQPFSLEDLELGNGPEQDEVTLPPSLKPFSLEESPPFHPPIQSPPDRPEPGPSAAEEEAGPDTGVYSWQLPSSKPGTDFLRESQAGERQGTSIFSKLKQRRQELPPQEEQPLPIVSVDDEEALQFFSEDDISLRTDEDEKREVAPEPEEDPSGGLPFSLGEPEPASPAMGLEEPGEREEKETDLAPFAFEESGFSFEDTEEVGGADQEAAEAAAEPFEPFEPFAMPEVEATEAVDEPPPAATTAEEPAIAPLSLEELGLSAEEIALLQQEQEGEETAPPVSESEAEEPDLAPFAFEEVEAAEEAGEAGGADQEAAEAAAEPFEPFAMPEVEATEAVDEPPPAATTAEEPAIAPLSLEELGLSAEEIALLQQEQEGEETVPPVSESEAEVEPAIEPFSLEETGFSPEMEETREAERRREEPGETELAPFSLEELGLTEDIEEPASPPSLPPRSKAPETQLLDDVDIQPFSLDELGLDEGGMFGLGDLSEQEKDRLGLTAEELSSLDSLGGLQRPFESAGEAPTPETMPDTGDPDLDRLIILGQREGFVDLTDIINIVEDPVAEAERIEDIGRALYRAGIEIRDGDEIIDMSDDYDYGEEGYEGEEVSENGYKEVDTRAFAIEAEEPEVAPLSLEELGLSADEIASLGLEEAEALPEEEPLSAPSTGPLPTKQPEPPADVSSPRQEVAPPEVEQPSGPPVQPEEPVIAPLSLQELGLTEEEIAMLGLGEGAGEQPAPPSAAEPTAPEPEPAPASEAPAPGTKPGPSTEEPVIAPLSLQELGLTEEEIAMLGLGVEGETPPAPPTPSAPSEPAGPAPAPREPEGTRKPEKPSAEGFGLTEEELARLGGLAAKSEYEGRPADVDFREMTGQAAERPEPTTEEEDLFSFDLPEAEHVPDRPAQPARRREEPAPEKEKTTSPEDLAFVPTPLDELDDIWDLPDVPSSEVPARITIERPAPRPEREREPPSEKQPAPPAPSLRPGLPGRKQPRPIQERRERPAWPGGQRRPARPEEEPDSEEEQTFIPTGDEELDTYLRQLEDEPDNHGLCLAIAHFSMEKGYNEVGAYHFNRLIKRKALLDEVVEDVLDLIRGTDDQALLQSLYRVLGDAYTRQKRFKEAMAAYRGNIQV